MYVKIFKLQKKNTKCIYNEASTDSEKKCIVKEICDQVSSPSKGNCEIATTLNDSKKKCVFLEGKINV